MALFNLGSSDMSGALGVAPTGLYSGLDPSASAGAFQGNPLGGGIAGQTAGNSALGGGGSSVSPAQLMLMQQIVNSAQQIGQQAQIQSNNLQQYADPVATVTPAMLGRQMMGA